MQWTNIIYKGWLQYKYNASYVKMQRNYDNDEKPSDTGW